MFFEKKRPEKRDMDMIKQALSDEELPLERPVRQRPARQTPADMDIVHDINEEAYGQRYRPRVPEMAPLFVKVEKYNEILAVVQDMKNFVSGIKQLFTIL